MKKVLMPNTPKRGMVYKTIGPLKVCFDHDVHDKNKLLLYGYQPTGMLSYAEVVELTRFLMENIGIGVLEDQLAEMNYQVEEETQETMKNEDEHTDKLEVKG